jgi:N-acetylmuramoyl-L-alanine amidase
VTGHRLRAAALLVAALLAGPVAAQAPGAPTIVIDPGHPSETAPGNVLLNGAREVEIAWSTSLLLRDLLRAEGMRVVLTKHTVGQMVTNRRRAEIANEAGATLLVRLHTDAGSGRGFALYYPDRQGTVAGTTGPARSVIEASERAARVLHRAMARALRGHLYDAGIKGDSETYVGSRQGALTGSIFSRVPAVTIEMVYLTNADDAKFIRTPEGQRSMARAIAQGVIAWTRESARSSPAR